MELCNAAHALSALGHERRLEAFRLLVRAGPTGVGAGEIAAKLNIPPSSLTTHLSILVQAGLVQARRNGRAVIYAVDFAGLKHLMAFLLDNCCQGLESCTPTQGICCDNL